MHNFSYLRVMFALLIPDGFTQRCDHGITCHCRFRIQYNTHTHTHAHTPTHTLPLFCISQTIVPIEPKFCMHMECDQSIKSHKNIKLIWGHLGYANEGQRSNLPLFCISETVGPIQILYAYGVWPESNHIKTSTWYEAILVMQMKVKGQSSFVLYLTLGFEPRFCVHMECLRQTYVIRTSSCEAILAMQMRSKVKSSFVLYLRNRCPIDKLNVIRQSFHKITPTY